MNLDTAKLISNFHLVDYISSEYRPYPPLRVPRYKTGIKGKWVIDRENVSTIARGYFTGLQPIGRVWILRKVVRGSGPVVWMSTAPMELESQSHHLAAAKGKVYIAGGGMGVLAWNCAQKPEVSSVLVQEIDPSIVALLEYQSTKNEWKNWKEKVRVVIGSVFQITRKTRFDVALIDIWPSVADPRILPDMSRIVQKVKADAYAAWSMEFAFMQWVANVKKIQKIHQTEALNGVWKEYAEYLGYPLILMDDARVEKIALLAVMQVLRTR